MADVKNVMVPVSLLSRVMLLCYWLEELELPEEIAGLAAEISAGLDAKLDAMKRREAYTRRLMEKKNFAGNASG